jgi:hypothetical protein
MARNVKPTLPVVFREFRGEIIALIPVMPKKIVYVLYRNGRFTTTDYAWLMNNSSSCKPGESLIALLELKSLFPGYWIKRVTHR